MSQKYRKHRRRLVALFDKKSTPWIYHEMREWGHEETQTKMRGARCGMLHGKARRKYARFEIRDAKCHQRQDPDGCCVSLSDGCCEMPPATRSSTMRMELISTSWSAPSSMWRNDRRPRSGRQGPPCRGPRRQQQEESPMHRPASRRRGSGDAGILIGRRDGRRQLR